MELTAVNTCPQWILLNDAETGYYQAAYQGDLMKKLLANGARQLTVAERVGVLGDLDVLVDAGEAPAGRALALVAEFSKDPAPQVVETAADIAGILKGRSVPSDLREKGAAFIRQEFGPQALALGWQTMPGDSDDTKLLRERLVPFVASVGEQKDLIDEAEKLAHGWLQGRQKISPDMIEPVLEVAAEFGNRDLFDLLRSRAVKEHDHNVREELLDALGSFRNPTLATASIDLLLSSDFDPREAFYPLLFGPLSYAETRDVPLDFVKQHLDALLKILPREVGEDYAASLPAVGRGFCEAKQRDELDSFFADRVKDYTGGPRVLAQTIESINLCIAARKTLAPELSAFLKQY
jgi:ERAP1-like C-terminal domain